MEWDFLGLNSKNVAMAMPLKEEFQDTSKNSAMVSGSSMQWSFSNKVSAVPQLLSFKASQDEKQRKIIVDPLVSSDTPNPSHRPYSSVIQNVASDKKAGNQYAMTVYPFQNAKALPVDCSQDVKMFPISNQPPSNAVPVAFNVPIFQSHLVPSGQPVVGSNVNLQPFGGVPIATSISVPFTSSVVGTTELRNASKPPGSMAQLTIFYAGSVYVYNDISPEKAQAIMLLAGSNGLPQTLNNILSTGQVKASFTGESFHGMPLLGLSNPHSKGHNAGVGSCSNTELPTAAKPIQTSVSSHPNHSEPPMDASSVAPISPIPPTFIPAAVPQARKASLARFLEKRKERINTCPYSVAKKTSDCSSSTLDLMA
ncbi:protein TIFY 6B-like isoform X2 [Benincasa hispida]|uniref:protein TIFY 6B-like isoform X2 n=1 Tax=Benincasa hispida TaxID=102211 RepID=UPI0019003D9A|nr:protein TIFY 6B-like isoform X2 [Benincasa hispida]